MPKINFLFFLNAYSDLVQTAAPALNNFRWSREINGVPFNSENDQQIQVLPGITTSNIVPYPFSVPTNSSTAILNSTNIINITTSPAGIAVDNLVLGTDVPLGTTVSSITATQYTFTVSSANATAGAVYSNNGQSFTIVSTIVAGTSLVSTGSGLPSGSGTLTLVSGTGDATITFSAFSQSTLVTMSAAATGSATETVTFYSPAAFIYMESDQMVSVIYNNGTPMVLNPFEVNGLTQPAVFFMAGPIYSLTVTNLSTTTANIFFASMG